MWKYEEDRLKVAFKCDHCMSQIVNWHMPEPKIVDGFTLCDVCAEWQGAVLDFFDLDSGLSVKYRLLKIYAFYARWKRKFKQAAK